MRWMKLAIPIDRLLAGAAEHRERHGRPLVTLAYAQSLDGSIAAWRGSPLALSGPEALVMTHQLRAAHDAILVGIGTVLADRPRLNVRLAEGTDPRPVVLDSRLRFPMRDCPLCERRRCTWIATTERADRRQQERLEAAGSRVFRVEADARGWVDLHALLPLLAEQGIRSLMVEGGARVITSFLTQRLVDQAVITLAPTLIGGLRAVESLHDGDGRRASGPGSFPQLIDPVYKRLGADLVAWGRLR